MRNLAQRSATAAKEIKALIVDSVDKVKSGTQLVNESGDTLKEILQGINRVSLIVSEIATASREQYAGIEQANQAISQMDDVTQQHAALAEETSAASETLNQQAQALVTLVSRFKLGEGVRRVGGGKTTIATALSFPDFRKTGETRLVPVVADQRQTTRRSDHDDWEEFSSED